MKVDGSMAGYPVVTSKMNREQMARLEALLMRFRMDVKWSDERSQIDGMISLVTYYNSIERNQ